MNKLIEIQNKLKVAKSQYNSFGKYNYRNCEDILEAVKPLLKEYECCLTLEDEIVLISDRFYIKSIANLFNNDGNLIAKAPAFAREEEQKKGMDAAQLTGATSSYSRKYALNGLFCIDDTKDSDTTNQHNKSENIQKIVKQQYIKPVEKLEQKKPEIKINFEALKQEFLDCTNETFESIYTKIKKHFHSFTPEQQLEFSNLKKSIQAELSENR
jgi:hypothetical protein